MKKIIFIAEYLLSFPGGAERSIYEELKNYSKQSRVIAYTFDPLYKKGKEINEGIHLNNFGLKYLFKLSLFTEVFINRNFVKKTISNIDLSSDEIIIQGQIAPIVARELTKRKIKYSYFLRDENNLNIFDNYEQGFKKILKYVKNIFEYIPVSHYKKLNIKAIKNANKVYANSIYMQTQAKKIFHKDSTVIYPKIYFTKKIKLNKNKQKFILFIGGNDSRKGYHIAKKIAKALPEQKFLFVGKYKRGFTKGNITYKSWTKNINELFEIAKIVIVPTICNEAFGRIPIEAKFFGIPCITSNKGGLPEANSNKQLIVKNIKDINDWIQKITKSC